MQESISENTSQFSSEQRVAALRGTMVSLMVLEIFNNNLEDLSKLLEEKATSAPDFFGNAPLLLDFNKLGDEVDIYWLEEVRQLLLANNFIPVGITGADKMLEEAARATSVAVWPSKGSKQQPTELLDDPVADEVDIPQAEIQDSVLDTVVSEIQVDDVQVDEIQIDNIHMKNTHDEIQVDDITTEPHGSVSTQSIISEEETSEPEIEDLTQLEEEEAEESEEQGTDVAPPADEEEVVETMVIRQPVRSGQKIFAKGRDLIVMSQVSTGAEIIADGHIHVYGTLRGRALAGANGKEDARIFCQDLQADLVAIAGIYATNDDLPEDKLRQAVQIFLQDEQLKINSL